MTNDENNEVDAVGNAMGAEIRKLRTQRDELLAATKALVCELKICSSMNMHGLAAMGALERAIARAGAREPGDPGEPNLDNISDGRPWYHDGPSIDEDS